jgi:hypothetical protein
MVEKTLVLDGLELNYQGIFDLNKLLRTIDELLSERGYKKSEKIREEIIKPTGKYFNIELRPGKAMTEFYSLMIKIRIEISDLQEVEVIVDNVKRTMNKGNVNMLFDAWTTTDYEHRWEQTPWYWILRGFFEKFFFKVHTDKYFNVLVDDTHHIYNNVKAHLNLHRFLTREKKEEKKKEKKKEK